MIHNYSNDYYQRSRKEKRKMENNLLHRQAVIEQLVRLFAVLLSMETDKLEREKVVRSHSRKRKAILHLEGTIEPLDDLPEMH